MVITYHECKEKENNVKKWIIIIMSTVTLCLSIPYAIARYLFLSAFTREGVKRKIMIKKSKEEQEKQEAEDKEWEKYNGFFKEGEEWFCNMDPECITITSFDGLRLQGYYLPCEDAKRTIVLVHGYHGSGIRDFGCVSKFYHNMECNVLIIDQRAHGKSEGRYIGFGVKERFDCLEWITYLNQRWERKVPIFLDGVSMGAATVLMTSGLELPSNVAGIIADCGFTSPWDICNHVLRKEYHLPSFPVLYIANFICKICAGYGFKDASTREAVKHSKVPILFVHGDKDEFVPTEMSRTNYVECDSEKELEIIKGAGHALSYFTETSRYEKKIKEFLEIHTVTPEKI